MQLKTLFRATSSETEFADAQQATYAIWRAASDAVAESYRSWTGSAPDESWLAHAAYLAALDREEQAARAYQDLVERLRTR